MGLRKKILNGLKSVFGQMSSWRQNTPGGEVPKPERQSSYNTANVTDVENAGNVESVNRNVAEPQPTTTSDKCIGSVGSDANRNPEEPLISEQQTSTAMFNGLQNTTFVGGTYVQNILNSNARGLELLEKRVASAAFHNSAQRIDPPRCHPDTRVAILQKIYDWIVRSDGRETWLMWLNGAAGAGKSAIMQSLAERCVKAAIAIASFFFFRLDSTRNTLEPLIATLVYQLIQAIPDIESDILLTIEHNPLIFDQSLEFQLQQLIIYPLLRLPPHLRRIFVVFIDGLDECIEYNRQSNLVKALGNVTEGRNIPVIFLVASRRETQIEAAFRLELVANIACTMELDEIQASDDIRRYLNAKFSEIKRTHLRKHSLPADWPSPADVENIVAKSSGQFIFAAVVMNYVSSPHAHPILQLDIIKGIRYRNPSSENPFAHLDALYQHIFSRVKELGFVRTILAFNLAVAHSTFPIMGRKIEILELIFQLAPGELEVFLADLAAVIKCEPGTKAGAEMTFLHASLPDFLLDKSRSEGYHIDLDENSTNLLCTFLKSGPLFPTHDLDVASNPEYWRLNAIRELLLIQKAKVSDRLQRAFMNFNFSFHSGTMANNMHNSDNCIQTLRNLQKMNLGDRGQAYRHVVDVFAAEYAKYWPSLSDHVKNILSKSPDLLARINRIRSKKKNVFTLRANRP